MPVLGGSGALAYTERGMWSPATTYSPGDLITFGPGRYVCAGPHLSTPVFNTAKFARLDGPSVELTAVQRGMLIDNFADTSMWTTSAGEVAPTITAQTDDSIYGTYMRVVLSTSTRIQRPLLVDVRNRFISFKYRAPVGSCNFGLVLMVGQNVYTGKRFQQTWGFNATDDIAGTGWRHCTVALPQLAASNGAVDADLADTRAIGFYLTSPSAAPITVEIADLRLHDSTLPPGLLWLFDDARATTYSAALPILAAAGMVGTVYAAPAVLGSVMTDGFATMTLAQLQEIKAAGWTVGCHGHTHTSFAGMAQATRLTEFDNCYSFLIANGLAAPGGAHLAYPFGQYDAQTLTTAQTYFRSARTTKNDGAITPFVGDRMRLRTLYPQAPGQSAAVWTAAMDRIVALGGVLPMTFHEVGPDGGQSYNISQATFQAIVDYAASKNLPSYTLDDLFPQQTPSPVVAPFGL